jgi:glyoxylase-like metal-dependent hydrolase (beta-lactamase superfamily II)
MEPPTAEMAALTADIRNKCTRTVPDGFSFDDYRIPPTTPTRRLVDGDTIDLGGRSLAVVHTPGHSPGSVCFFDQDRGMLFTGDTANRGLVTLSLELCDIPAYARSMARLVAMGGTVDQVFPAHWATPVGADSLVDLREGVGRVLRDDVGTTDMGTWLRADFERFAISLPRPVG